MMIVVRICIIFVVLAAVIGCSTPKTHVVEEQDNSIRLPFVRNGITTRAQIMFRLGEPSSIYENGKIITYWFIKKAGDLEVTNKLNVTEVGIRRPYNSAIQRTGYYNLVLVFADNDILESHSLVFIR